MNRIITLCVVLLSLASCKPDNIEEPITDRNDISLTFKGDLQMSYTPETCQMGYNTGKNEFRVYEDKFSSWFTVRCSQKPSSVGQSITADVAWTGEKSTKVFNALPFTVEKTDEEGKIWLWNSTKSIGIIIKDIQ